MQLSRNDRFIAEITVDRIDDNQYFGNLKNDHIPGDVRAILQEHAENIEQGVLQFLNEYRSTMQSLGIVASCDGGTTWRPIADFQLYDNGGVTVELFGEDMEAPQE